MCESTDSVETHTYICVSVYVCVYRYVRSVMVIDAERELDETNSSFGGCHFVHFVLLYLEKRESIISQLVVKIKRQSVSSGIGKK